MQLFSSMLAIRNRARQRYVCATDFLMQIDRLIAVHLAQWIGENGEYI